MPLSADHEHRLVGDIYDAALEPALWPRILETVNTRWAANSASILIGDQLNPDYLVVHTHGISDALIRLYAEGGYAEPNKELTRERHRHGTPIGEATANHKVFGGIDNFKKAAGRIYDEFYVKAGILYQAGGLLEDTDYRYSFIGLARGPQDAPFSDEETHRLTCLMSHIRRAMQIHRHLSAHQARNAPLYRMIDTMATGIFLLDGTGTVRHANPAAEKVLRDNAAIRMNAKGALSLAKPDKQAEFANLLRGATATGLRERASTDEGRLPPGGVLGLADGPGELPLMMTVTPLSAMSGYEDLASDGIAAGVFVTDPAAPRLLARGLLMRNFLLNSRECDICEAFVNFPSPEAIADQLGLTISTVRGYFKAIYAKTGRHSQAELMRLLMGVVVEFEHVR